IANLVELLPRHRGGRSPAKHNRVTVSARQQDDTGAIYWGGVHRGSVHWGMIIGLLRVSVTLRND
ncbi:MAG: hypothetical protein WA960_19985, partial [Tunicatimonas sp.]